MLTTNRAGTPARPDPACATQPARARQREQARRLDQPAAGDPR